MIVSAAVLLHIVPWVGHAAARSGSSPEPGGGGRWAGPPPAPCGSPPAAAARWPPPVPVPPPSPGNAALAHKTSALTSTKGTPRTQGKFLSACPAGLTWMTAFLSARGRFFASLSASSHSRITWAQKKKGREKHWLNLSICFIAPYVLTQSDFTLEWNKLSLFVAWTWCLRGCRKTCGLQKGTSDPSCLSNSVRLRELLLF